MSNKRPKPIFHEASEVPKEEFKPHHVGAADDSEEIYSELLRADDVIESALTEEIEPIRSVEEPETVSPPAGETPAPADALGNIWRLITEEQQNGATYFVTHDLSQPPSRAFWRKTRVLDHFRWKLYGKWSDALTRVDILPQPIYYKEIY